MVKRFETSDLEKKRDCTNLVAKTKGEGTQICRYCAADP